MIGVGGPGTTAISKVKGHADEGTVFDGRVCELDRIGNDLADRAADFGRRRVEVAVTDVREGFSRACGFWFPLIKDLHRFFIAIVRVVVDEDGMGGTAPDPFVWCSGAVAKSGGW